ncbi:MAG: hypothetical protein K2I21_07610, partial [Acetatifactor sp.]|nr:hypothetical protein [Acetatifactor sp.]
MKGVKRFLVFFLSCALALSTMGLTPMAARAEETLSDVDNSAGFRKNESTRIEVTETEQTYVFTSTTESTATANWNAPVFFVYSGNDELFAGRSDLYGWAGAANTNGKLPTGYDYQRLNVPADDAAWAAWLDVNKAGADCKITMRKVEDYVIVALSDNGVTSIVTVPVSGTAQVTLSGDFCKLTNITSSEAHIDLSAAIDKIKNGGDDVPKGTFELVDNSTGFRTSESPRIEVTETEQTYTFTSTTTDAKGNYCTPAFFVYSESGEELFAGRSDAWGWALNDFGGKDILHLPKGYNYQTSNVPADEAAWAPWLEANKAGVECKITMRQVGNYAVVALSNNGVTSITTIPTSGTVSVALSGENCKLENIVSSSAHLDLSAAIDQIPTDEPGTDEPGTDEPGTDEPGTDTPGGVFLDCPGWWQAHTAGMEITEEPQTYTFHSKTYESGKANWNTPLFVVFSSEDGLVKEAGAAGYTEYGVIRSDHYHWGDSISETSVVYPAGFDADWDASWAAWQAANRAGVDCAVTTQLYNGYAVVGVSNNGITTTYAIKVNPAVKNYLSLTGELCTLSNLQTSDQHIDLTAAKAGADAGITPSNNSNNSNATTPPPQPPTAVRAIAGGAVLSA